MFTSQHSSLCCVFLSKLLIKEKSPFVRLRSIIWRFSHHITTDNDSTLRTSLICVEFSVLSVGEFSTAAGNIRRGRMFTTLSTQHFLVGDENCCTTSRSSYRNQTSTVEPHSPTARGIRYSHRNWNCKSGGLFLSSLSSLILSFFH
jgi:hypothetical protein